jgi:hypothetical protein
MSSDLAGLASERPQECGYDERACDNAESKQEA